MPNGALFENIVTKRITMGRVNEEKFSLLMLFEMLRTMKYLTHQPKYLPNSEAFASNIRV